MTGRREPPLPADDPVAGLVRLAGPRPAAPTAVEAAVRAAVTVRWQELVAARRRRARGRIGAAIAALLLVALGVWRWRPGEPPPAAVVTAGAAVVVPAGSSLALGERVASGATTATGPDRTAAFSPCAAVSVRLAAGTAVRWDGPTSLALERGRLYVDSAGGCAAGKLAVQTPFGRVREVGTRFEVSLDDTALRIRVRDGGVSLERPEARWEAAAGEELVWTAGGVERRPAPIFGSSWEWVVAAAPPVDLDGRSLASILDWTARETGWQVRFADDTTRRRYADEVLVGALRGVRPDEVPQRILPAFGLGYRLADGVLVVAEEGR